MAIKRLRDEEDETEIESLKTANYLILLSRGDDYRHGQKIEPVECSPRRVFECRTCNRQFGSFQALGGHRASHKKPRTIDDLYKHTSPVKPKFHECPICGLDFPIGQALGGHMRRHRNEVEGLGLGGLQMVKKSLKKKGMFVLDLNSPPSEDEQPQLFFGLGLTPKFPQFINT